LAVQKERKTKVDMVAEKMFKELIKHSFWKASKERGQRCERKKSE
jgi:hypothetical protein